MKDNIAEQAYLNHVKRTEEILYSIGDNPQKINAFITNTYLELSQKEPGFLWFSLGAIVSSTVGQNLQASGQAFIHSAEQSKSAKLAFDSFANGNKAIFKDIVPLFLTYKSVGIGVAPAKPDHLISH